MLCALKLALNFEYDLREQGCEQERTSENNEGHDDDPPAQLLEQMDVFAQRQTCIGENRGSESQQIDFGNRRSRIRASWEKGRSGNHGKQGNPDDDWRFERQYFREAHPDQGNDRQKRNAWQGFQDGNLVADPVSDKCDGTNDENRQDLVHALLCPLLFPQKRFYAQ